MSPSWDVTIGDKGLLCWEQEVKYQGAFGRPALLGGRTGVNVPISWCTNDATFSADRKPRP